jgi:hypothetical protein
MVSSLNDAVWLAWIEKLLVGPAPHSVPVALPPSRFHCRLDDQPNHLTPGHEFRSQAWEDLADRPLFVHPHLRLTRDGELPLSEEISFLDNFAPECDKAWIKDPGSRMLQPFWLSAEVGAILADALPGNPAPLNLPLEVRPALIMAGILVAENYEAKRRVRWAQIIGRCGAEFREKGYAPLGGLIHPFLVAALRRYYRYMIRAGRLPLGDSQSSRRYIAHNESVARFFHHQLTATMTAVAGEKVKPSYVYMGSYKDGAKLEKHTDREQCEFSMTFCLDFSPEPENETSWPLRLHTDSGTVTVFQRIGDALFYRGCQLPHSRDPLPHGRTSTSIFFHYVREDFAGPLD